MKLKNSNYLQEIITTLAKHDVEYIICGGVALVLHGVERMTMDLDLAVDMSENNIRKFLSAMKNLKLVPRAPVPAETLLDPEKREMMVNEKNALVFTFIDINNPYRQVDVFLADELSYDALKDDIETIDIYNCLTKLVSRDMLLQMKKAVKPLREKDLFDIHVLERLINNKSTS